jgi:hypothetical protein
LPREWVNKPNLQRSQLLKLFRDSGFHIV